jgi:hypothetical protein
MIIFFCIAMIAALASAQETPPSLAGIAVLSIEGDVRYQRAGWRQLVAVQPGILLAVGDTVFSDDATLTVMCPDGGIMDIFPGELLPEDTITCPTTNSVVEVDGIQVPSLQRGGRQDASIPYLISPRRTLVRTTDVEIRWNNPGDVLEYQLRVFGGGGTVYPQTAYDPALVVNADGENTVTLSLDLQPNTAYSVEICVLFADLRHGCTTDPGWSTGTNVAFYYDPAPQLNGQFVNVLETDIISQLGANTPESLYARAVLFSQGMTPDANGDLVGLTSEALDLLDRLLTDYPDSPLAASGQVHLLRGSLYSGSDLPLSAARALIRAQSLAPACSPTAALAAYGLANTDPNPDNTVGHLTVSLNNNACLLEPDAFTVAYEGLCAAVGDICNDLPSVSEF